LCILRLCVGKRGGTWGTAAFFDPDSDSDPDPEER